MTESDAVLNKIRLALGRTAPLSAPPQPPMLDEPTIRLVSSDIGLSELFVKAANDNKMLAELISVDNLGAALVEFLSLQNARRIALADSDLLKKTGVSEALRSGGLEVKVWPEVSLDQLYDFDAGITDVYAAVAETGSVVVRASPGHGRALSLVPPIHVAIVEPKNLLPDLVDLFAKMSGDGANSSTSIITGPSKTSDIEMNLVVGVHGPIIVKIFVLG